jgi:hypothetical protein
MGAVLRGMIQVRGTANIGRFSYYKFEIWSEKTPAWSFLMRSGQSVTNGVLMTWDAAAVSPGAYRLRLIVVDETGNYPEPCELRVIVER